MTTPHFEAEPEVPPRAHVLAGFVTYGERAHLWLPVVERLRAYGVRVVAVDNGAGEMSAALLRDYQSRGQIAVHEIGRNAGTAVAFGTLLRLASNSDAEFLWMLDDDIVPNATTIDHLLAAWEALGGDHRATSLALVANRVGRGGYFGHIARGIRADRAFPHRSSFLHFDVLRAASRAFPRRARAVQCNLVPIPYGPYGGLFMHRDLCRTIRPPRPDLVLYHDDSEFTYRMTRSGIDLVMVRDAVLGESQPSWGEGRGLGSVRALLDADATRVEYAVRNRAWFETACYGRRGMRRRINFAALCALLLASCRSRDDLRRFGRLVAMARAGAAGRLGELAVAGIEPKAKR